MLVCRRPPDRCWTWHRTERKEERTYMLSIRRTDHILLNEESLIQEIAKYVIPRFFEKEKKNIHKENVR